MYFQCLKPLCVRFFLICIDSIREMVKYTHSDKAEASMANNPNTVDHIHMKLFRAQRNFYIAGFSLFLWLYVSL